MAEKRKITKAQLGHVQNYIKNHYDRMEVVMPKGYKDILKETAKANKTTVSKLLLESACKQYNLAAPEFPTDNIDESKRIYNPYRED